MAPDAPLWVPEMMDTPPIQNNYAFLLYINESTLLFIKRFDNLNI